MNTSDNPTSSKALENRADAKRSEISETLDKLEQKVSPGELMDQAMSVVREHGGGIAQNLATTARDNPLPLILTGVGLAWLIASQSSAGRQRYEGYADYGEWDDDLDWEDSAEGTPAIGSSHRPAMHAARYRGGETSVATIDSNKPQGESSTGDSDESLIDKVSEKAEELSDSVEQKRREVGRRARSAQLEARARANQWRAQGRRRAHSLGGQAQNATRQIQGYFQQEPLVAGALGIALGAVIGSLLPSTDVEDRHLGERSDEITDQVKQHADSAVKQSREKIEEAAQSAKATASEKIEAESQSNTSTVA